MTVILKTRQPVPDYDGIRWSRVWAIIFHHRAKRRPNTEGEIQCLKGEVERATGPRFQVLRRELRGAISEQEYAYIFGSDTV